MYVLIKTDTRARVCVYVSGVHKSSIVFLFWLRIEQRRKMEFNRCTQMQTQNSMQECVCVVQFELFMKLYKLAECLLLFYRSVSHIFRFQLGLISLCAVFERYSNILTSTLTRTCTHLANETKQNAIKRSTISWLIAQCESESMSQLN